MRLLLLRVRDHSGFTTNNNHAYFVIIHFSYHERTPVNPSTGLDFNGVGPNGFRHRDSIDFALFALAIRNESFFGRLCFVFGQ